MGNFFTKKSIINLRPFSIKGLKLEDKTHKPNLCLFKLAIFHQGHDISLSGQIKFKQCKKNFF